jgi:hypothetical protein
VVAYHGVHNRWLNAYTAIIGRLEYLLAWLDACPMGWCDWIVFTLAFLVMHSLPGGTTAK